MPRIVRRDRAALAAVEPAVRAPGERVGHRVGVLHAEAAQQHLRVAVRDIVAVAVRVEEQVGSCSTNTPPWPNAKPLARFSPVTKSEPSARLGGPVGIEDGEPVGPFRPVRRRLGDAVVDRARIAIDLDSLQTRRVRVLQILHDPEPAAVVEVDRDRLAHCWFTRRNLNSEANRHGHFPGRRVGRIALSSRVRRLTRAGQTTRSPLQRDDRASGLHEVAAHLRASRKTMCDGLPTGV